MPVPLTASSVLMCPHGGVVQILVTSTSVRTESGAPVAKMTDPTVVNGCPFNLGRSPRPCLTVQWVTGNSQLLVDGVPSLDQTSIGICQGAGPAGAVIIVHP